MDINGGFNLGYEFHDNSRYISQLNEEVKADYNSLFLNPWLSLEHSYPLQDNLELRPSLLLNYTFARYGGYGESGAQGFALAVEDRTASNLTTRLQLAGVWNLPEHGSELGLRVGLEGRFTGGSKFQWQSGQQPQRWTF